VTFENSEVRKKATIFKTGNRVMADVGISETKEGISCVLLFSQHQFAIFPALQTVFNLNLLLGLLEELNILTE